MTAVPKTIDRLNAVANVDASPESIRYVPRNMTPANFQKIISLLGIQEEIKAAAATGGNIDVAVIDSALSKTRLSPAEKIELKIGLLGSGFDGKAF